jgi:hypothetical protein
LEPLLIYFVVYWSRYWFILLFIGTVIDLLCCLFKYESLSSYFVAYLFELPSSYFFVYFF